MGVKNRKLRNKVYNSQSKKGVESVPLSGAVLSASAPSIGIVGWNSPRFWDSHSQFIESLKNVITSRGGKPLFLGISGGSDFFTFGASNGNKLPFAGHSSFYPPSHYRLPSRDIVADQIEIMIHEEALSGLVMVPWSVSSLVGMMMGVVRCGVPAIFLPNYPCWLLPEEEKLYSRYSMLLLLEIFGLTKIGALENFFVRGKEEEKSAGSGTLNEEFVKWGGQKIVEMVEQKISPRRFFSQSAFENCLAIDLALGGSTETILHLGALAQEAAVSFPLSMINGAAKKIPQLVAFNHFGELPLAEFSKSGGVAGLLGACAQFLGPCPTVGGKNISDIAKASSTLKSSFKFNSTAEKGGSLGVLYGNLAREGALFRVSALKEQWFAGSRPVKVFNSEKSCSDAVLSKKVKKGDLLVVRYCGPKGSPGMPPLSDLENAVKKNGLEGSVMILTDGRISLSGKSPAIVHISSEAANGSTLSILQDGDVVQWNFFERSLNARLTETEIRVRLSRWKQQERQIKNSYLYRYSKYSSSSAYGATLV